MRPACHPMSLRPAFHPPTQPSPASSQLCRPCTHEARPFRCPVLPAGRCSRRPPARSARNRPNMRALLLLVALLGASSAMASVDYICQTYVVQSGDSLYGISNKFGIQMDDLQAALQQCVGYTGTLQVGQKICLTGWVPACDYVIDSDGMSNCKIYQIQSGDTMNSIASTFGIYAQDLQTLNADLINGVLQVGKFIRLPPWAPSCPDPDSEAQSCRVYTVQAGDFMFGIASIFRVSLADLLAVNTGLSEGSYLQAGQRVRIPPFTATCGNGIVAVPDTTGIFSCRAYKVKSGNSLSSIALLFETTVNALVAANPELSDPSLLTPGKVVKVPPFPAECVGGILVDPTSSAPATPAGPIASPTPAASPATTPSPAASTPSPSPSPATASPSPSPVVASPAPVKASPSPSPTPSPATVPPSSGIKVQLTLSGIAPSTFSATKSAQLAASLASLMGVPVAWVNVAAAAPSTRRLQAAGDATTVTVTLAATDPAAAAARLQSAVASGAVASMLSQLGLTLATNSLSVSSYGTPTSPSPSPSPVAASPSPSPAASAPTSSGSGGSNVGAIVGGVVGGVGGTLLLAGLAWFIVKRRRAAAAAGAGDGGLRTNYAGATAQVSTAGAGLTVKAPAAGRLAMDSGVSSSPRNTVTPRTRVNQLA
ncbi:hypothetical protein ABPG75_001433 [Micractinium tetrahymenae]